MLGVASHAKQKAKDAAAIRQMRAEYFKDIVEGVKTPDQALKEITEELKNDLAAARNQGKAMKEPANKAKQLLIDKAQQNTAIKGRARRSVIRPSSHQVQAAVHSAGVDAKVLTKFGAWGKVAYTGIFMAQMLQAADDDAKAEELETTNPHNLTQTGLGIGFTILLDVAIFAAFGPVGLIAAIAIGLASGIVFDAVAELIVDELEENIE